MTPDERAQIRAEAIRECIAALPQPFRLSAIHPDNDDWLRHGDVVDALESLLPKPDPVDELVEEFFSIGGPLNSKMMDRDPGVASVEACRVFASWLIMKGKINA